MGDPEYTIVQIVHLDETGDSYHRMRWPAATLAAQEPTWRILNLHWTAQERYDLALKADLLVLFQCADPYMLDVLRKRKQQGRETLVEYNDNFYAPSPASPVAPHWSSPILWQTYESFLKEASGVIVTGKGLSQLFKEKTENPIHILENNFHHTLKDFNTLWDAKGEHIKFGWAGSLGHFADVYQNTGVILDLLKQYPNSTFSFMGNTDLFRELKLPAHRTKYHAWGSMQQYLQFWESVHIGFTPLLDHPYNHCRSDVKALEIAASGAVPILSTVGPYKEFLTKCKLPSFKTNAELKKALDGYLKDPVKAKKAAKKAHSWVEKNRLAKNDLARSTLYQQYMKEPLRSITLPLKNGYYELYGTREEVKRNEIILSKSKALQKQNEFDKAVQLLLNNRVDHDLLLQGFTLLSKKRRAQAAHFLEQIIPHQKLDLRFLLLFTRITSSDDARLSGWSRLLRSLESLEAVAHRFYSEMVLAEFLTQIRKHPRLLAITEKVLQLYPTSVDLLFIQAREKAQQGDAIAAADLSARALQSFDDHTLNQRTLVSREMIASWNLASS